MNDFKPKTQYFEIVMGIRGGSPMNESDLLMTSLPLVLPPHYHNSSSLNYSDAGVWFMIQQAVSRTSTAHVLSTEDKVPKSVRVALTYEEYLFLKYLVKFHRVYLTN